MEDKPALIVSVLTDEDLSSKNDLKVGDVILSVDGEPLATRKAFLEKVAWTRPEDKLEMAVWRDGEIYEKSVFVKPSRLDVMPQNKNEDVKVKNGVYFEKIGLTLQNLVVTDVAQNSEAAAKGVKAGDEIKGLNGRSLSQADDLGLYIEESAESVYCSIQKCYFLV